YLHAIGAITTARDALADEMNAALNGAAFARRPVNPATARLLIDRAGTLLNEMEELAGSSVAPAGRPWKAASDARCYELKRGAPRESTRENHRAFDRTVPSPARGVAWRLGRGLVCNRQPSVRLHDRQEHRSAGSRCRDRSDPRCRFARALDRPGWRTDIG